MQVLFAAFKRNLKADIKVAQLAGYVSEHAAYHHGEAALGATIVGMAQDFVGANNAPLLVPSGQFGTRLQGGKDCDNDRGLDPRGGPPMRNSDRRLLRVPAGLRQHAPRRLRDYARPNELQHRIGNR